MSLEYIKKWAPFLCVLCAFLMLFIGLDLLVPIRVGDGSEYYALFIAWQETFRPWMSVISFDAYERLYSSNQIIGLVTREWLVNAFPALKLGITADFNHFWFYSFLAFAISKLFSLVGLSLTFHSSFLTLHFTLVTFTAIVAFHFYSWRGLLVFLILTLASPMLWFLNKVHTELFTYCLTLSAIIFVYSKSYLSGAFLLALASTQNPSFALIAFVPFCYRLVLHRNLKFNFLEVCLVVGTVLAVLAHPTYYFLRFGVLTPQLLAGGASLGGNLSLFYIWILDPDLGLLPNWPVGVVFIIIATYLHFFSKVKKEKNSNIFFYFFIIIFFLINFYAHSSTANLNSGATPGLARYSLWYLPLAFPLVHYVVTNFPIKKVFSNSLILMISVIIFYSMLKNNPGKGEEYSKPTWFSTIIQSNVPLLYNPPSEVFAERYSGVGESIHSLMPRGVLGPDCRKLLIYPGKGRSLVTTSSHCQIDQKKIRVLAESIALTSNKEFFTLLNYNELLDLKFVVSLGQYSVGRSGSGNFILNEGWSAPEEWRVRSEGRHAQISLPCNSSQFYFKNEKVHLTLKLQPFGKQEVDISQSGVSLYKGVIEETEEVGFSGLVNECKKDSINFDINILKPQSPFELEQSNDYRKLGIGLIEFTIK
jgi:hypothetical protein